MNYAERVRARTPREQLRREVENAQNLAILAAQALAANPPPPLPLPTLSPRKQARIAKYHAKQAAKAAR